MLSAYFIKPERTSHCICYCILIFHIRIYAYYYFHDHFYSHSTVFGNSGAHQR